MRKISWVLAMVLGAAPLAHAQLGINPFRTAAGARLSAHDTDLLLESIARLNTAEPETVGATQSWSNPKTGSSGTSTLERVFPSRGMDCHRVLHHVIFAGHEPGHDYRFTWCRTPSGVWKARE